MSDRAVVVQHQSALESESVRPTKLDGGIGYEATMRLAWRVRNGGRMGNRCGWVADLAPLRLPLSLPVLGGFQAGSG